MFIGFANFYQRFIQSFSRITVLLTSILKTTGSFKELALKTFRADDDEVVNNGISRVNKTVRNSSEKSMHVPNIGAIRESNFLTPNAKKTFNYLWLAFIKAPILQYFDFKSHI